MPLDDGTLALSTLNKCNTTTSKVVEFLRIGYIVLVGT
jgi:hypothetical protein